MSLVNGQMIKRNGRSRYRGVSFHKGTGKWRAMFCFSYEVMHVGLFNTELEARDGYERFRKRFFNRLRGE